MAGTLLDVAEPLGTAGIIFSNSLFLRRDSGHDQYLAYAQHQGV